MNEKVIITADRFEELIRENAELETELEEAESALAILHGRINSVIQNEFVKHNREYGKDPFTICVDVLVDKFGIVLDEEEIEEARAEYLKEKDSKK